MEERDGILFSFNVVSDRPLLLYLCVCVCAFCVVPLECQQTVAQCSIDKWRGVKRVRRYYYIERKRKKSQKDQWLAFIFTTYDNSMKCAPMSIV